MTCIVAVVENRAVFIGADAAASMSYLNRISKVPKVFIVDDRFIVGYTTSFRMGQVLRHHLSVRSQFPEEDDMAYMVKAFVEAVRAVLKEYGFSKVESNVEKVGQFIVGYNGQLYIVDSDLQVNRWSDAFDACGAGEQFALAVMMALPDVPPKKRIERALEIASYFCPSVRPPFIIKELKP